MPTLSILLMCWNHAPFIKQCIDSLKAQTSHDFEVIFLDNLSTDGSFELASRLLTELEVPVTLIQNETPQRVSVNNNRLLAAATGELVAIMSTDDWYAPAYVERMIDAGQAHHEVGMFYPDGFHYFQDEDRLEPIDSSNHISGFALQPLLEGKSPIFHIGNCFPRRVVTQLGGWDESLQIEDLDFLVRLTSRYPVQRVEEPLVYYRRSSSSASLNLPYMIAGWEQFHAKHRDASFYDMDDWLTEKYRAYAAAAVDIGDLALAQKLLAKAISRRPFSLNGYRTLAYLLRRHLMPARKASLPGRRG